MEEVWKPVRGFEGLYEVSNLGQIKSLSRTVHRKNNRNQYIKGRIIRPAKTLDGYLRICLLKSGKRKSFLVHRLVAEAFIPNPKKLLEVNHKDEDKQNNNVNNLEWCSRKYNNNYKNHNVKVSRANKNGKKSKPLLQLDLNDNVIKKWPSTQEASRHGFSQGGVSGCCRGKYKQYKEYHWEYITKVES